MKNAIVKLGFCLLFVFFSASAFAAGPTVTVSRVGGSTQRSATGDVSFNVVFSAAVTGFGDAPADFDLSGSDHTAGITAAVLSGSGTTYVVKVSGITLSGDIKLMIPSNSATDGSNGNQASNTSTITFDSNPQPTITHPGQSDPTTGESTISFQIDFDEAIDPSDPLAESDFSFTGSTGGLGTLSVDAGSLVEVTPGITYTFTVTVATTASAPGDVKVSLPSGKVKDAAGNPNNATSASSKVTYNGLLLTIAAPTATSTSSSVKIFGEVLTSGGSTVSDRGTVWSTTSPVTLADHNASEGGTGTGTFNQTRSTSIAVHARYYYATWAQNIIGTVLSPQSFIWTLDSNPTATGNISAINATSGTTIDLTFDAFGAGAKGIVILRKTGSSGYASSDLLNGKAPNQQPGYVTTITSSTATTFTDTGLSGGTQYSYVTVPFNVFGAQDSTTNYATSFNSKNATTIVALSRIIQKNAPANTLAYGTKQGTIIASASDGLTLADLTLVDGNAPANDPDTKDTNVKSLTLHVDNASSVNHVGILKGSTVLAEGPLDASGNITFNINGGDLQATDDDDSGVDFKIIANFPAVVSDGAVIQVTITGATVYGGSSSGFIDAAAGGYTTGTTKNAIAVVATKYVITGLPSLIHPDEDFTFTATLKDALDNIDTNIGGNMTATLNAADGDMTPATPSVAVTAGAATFTVQLSDAEDDRRITLHTTAGFPSDYLLSVDVLSTGVDPVGPTLALCFNSSSTTDHGTFTAFSPIKIKESNRADFKTGTGLTYSIVLPDGFIFDKNPATPATLTITSGSEVNTPLFVGYNTAGTVAYVKYNVSGTVNTTLDEISINGLMVKYVGIVKVTNQPVLRIGGTAQISGDSETDGKAHGLLSSQNNPDPDAAVSFKITNTDLQSSETNFSKTYTNPIILQGTKASDGNSLSTGSFTGTGVQLDSDNKYKFYPSSIIPGSYDITYANIPDAVSGCISTVTKTFTVYASVINGLATKYCQSDPDVVLGTPNNMPTGTCFPSGNKYDFVEYVFGYSYQGGQIFYFSLGNVIGGTTFSPSSYSIYGIFGYETYVGYHVRNNCPILFEASDLYFSDKITINLSTFAQFNTLPANICETNPVINLQSPVFNDLSDTFWTTIQGSDAVADVPANARPGIGGDRAHGFTFTPSVALNGGNPSNQVQINYEHVDPNTGCTSRSTELITIFKKPGAVQSSQVSIKGVNGFAGEFCEQDGLTEFSGTTDPLVEYNWYDDPKTRSLVPEGDIFPFNSFIPLNGSFAKVGVYHFNVTQTLYRNTGAGFNGCESDGQQLTVTITQKTIVNPLTDVTICAGNPVDLSKFNASISTPESNMHGTWTSSTTPVNTNFTGGNRFPAGGTFYNPTTDEWSSRGFDMTLTSDHPVGACPVTSATAHVTINPGVIVSFPINPVTVCATSNISVDTKVENTNNFTWSKVSGLGHIDATTTDKITALYQADVSEQNQGGTVVLQVQSDDPDGPGPCQTVTQQVQIIISQKPTVDAGSDSEICSNEIINLHGVIPAGLSSATSATWATVNADTVITNPSALTTTYYLSKAGPGKENPGAVSTQTKKSIIFRLTSNTPVFPNVCPAQKDSITVTIHGKPEKPSAKSPAPYCVGDNIKLLSAGGTNITWYNSSLAQISTGVDLSTGVVSDAEKTVTFFATQTFDKLAPFAGCESDTAKVAITVNPLPLPIFSFDKQCLNDIMQFTDQSTLAQPSMGSRHIKAWQWNFDDNLGSTDLDSGTFVAGVQDGRTTGTYKDPGHKFKNTGTYNVKLTLLTSDGCTNSFTQNTPGIKVGPIPDANFAVLKICDEDVTEFTSSTGLDVSEIVNFAWNFGDASSSNNSTIAVNPTHNFTGVGTYAVKLRLETDLHCKDSTTQDVSILKYVKTFPYQETFEGSDHGWVTEGIVQDVAGPVSESSWNLLTSAGEIGADPTENSGAHFWATHTNVAPEVFYYDNERSVLYGPCVDMTHLARPVIAMDYFSDLEDKSDGVYLEYKDESTDVAHSQWTRLGQNGSGLNWYSESSIGGLSLLNGIGQQLSQDGWSGIDSLWRTGRYNMDDFAHMTRVRFRVVFGSNSSPIHSDTLDGFALDNFKLETRNRTVLVENFTSQSAKKEVVDNTAAFQVFPVSATSSNEVVKIEYHTGLPANPGDTPDPVFTQNPMDPNARASFYGLSAVPRGYIDGYSNFTGAGMFSQGTWANDYYNTESLKTSPIDIVIDPPTVTNGVINIKGTVTVKDMALDSNKYTMYVAVVEKQVNDDQWVLRKMLPSAGGRKVAARARGGSFTFSEFWPIDKAYVSANPELVAVAFIQSDIVSSVEGEKQVLQAAYNDDVPDQSTWNFTTGLEIPYLLQTTLYPNPADRLVNIELPEATTAGVEVHVFDQLGRPVLHGNIGAGESSIAINTTPLAASVYIVQLIENGVHTNRRLVITHKD